MGKIIASSYERYNGGIRIKRQWGSSTVTVFCVYREEDKDNPSAWELIKGYGASPGERKTYAVRVWKETHGVES
jgi:hypothetical protein